MVLLFPGSPGRPLYPNPFFLQGSKRVHRDWRGRPLVSHEVIVALIGTTTTQTGLRVEAQLDRQTYPTRVEVSDEQLAQVQLRPHQFHGEWNYGGESDWNKQPG